MSLASFLRRISSIWSFMARTSCFGNLQCPSGVVNEPGKCPPFSQLYMVRYDVTPNSLAVCATSKFSSVVVISVRISCIAGLHEPQPLPALHVRSMASSVREPSCMAFLMSRQVSLRQ